MKLKDCLKCTSSLVEEWYHDNIFVDSSSPSYNIYNAMGYSFNAGGKRLRPLLVLLGYGIANPLEINIKHPALPFAVGVEMIHTYSLIHDDLPGMDNDDLRRGKPTNHIMFGEAAAILAGDALLTKAFELFLTPSYFPDIPVGNLAKAALEMAAASGPDGMIAGQYADMAAQGGQNSMTDKSNIKNSGLAGRELLEYIHLNKTAALISSSITAGAILAGGCADMRDSLSVYGKNIGRAFQITDDILDVTATTEEIGKPAGSDMDLDKLTYPKLIGLDKAIDEARECVDNAVEAIACYKGEAGDLLIELAQYILCRRS